MLETSKDALNLLLGLSVLLVAVFFSWMIYQMGRMLKKANDTISGIQNVVTSIDELVKKFKEKSGDAMTYLTVLIKSGQEVMNFIQKKKTTRNRKKTNRTEEEK
jgi:translation initiation factor 2B subunit (eIF-2B alpha/beta/delta family)